MYVRARRTINPECKRTVARHVLNTDDKPDVDGDLDECGRAVTYCFCMTDIGGPSQDSVVAEPTKAKPPTWPLVLSIIAIVAALVPAFGLPIVVVLGVLVLIKAKSKAPRVLVIVALAISVLLTALVIIVGGSGGTGVAQQGSKLQGTSEEITGKDVCFLFQKVVADGRPADWSEAFLVHRDKATEAGDMILAEAFESAASNAANDFNGGTTAEDARGALRRIGDICSGYDVDVYAGSDTKP